MKKAQSRPTISEKELGLRDAVKLWLDDEEAYNDLAIHHNALVTHLQKFCQ